MNLSKRSGRLGFAMAAAFALASHVHAQDELDLLAYWDFNDTKDATKTVDVAKGVIAEITNAKFGPGRSGKAGDSSLNVEADLTGVAKVTDASFANKAGAKDVMTVVFWQKNTSDVRNQSAFWFTGDGQDRAFQSHTPWGDRTIYFDTGGGCCDAATQRINGPVPDDVDLNAWGHWAYIKNKEKKTVYINGVVVLEGESTNPLPATFTDLRIGNLSGDNASVPGLIDDFGVFANALTAAQIKSLASGVTPLELLDNSDPGIELAKTVSLGQLPNLSKPQNVSVNIRSTGKTKPLAISSFKITGGDTANFTLVSFPATIPPKSAAEAKFTFDTKGVGKNYAVTLEVKTDDPDKDDSTIIVSLQASVSTNKGADGKPDSDLDGLGDDAEVDTHKTNPVVADTDSDGLKDGAEITAKTDVFKPDSDGDGWLDGMEFHFGGDPLNPADTFGVYNVRHIKGNGQFDSMDTFKTALADKSQVEVEITVQDSVIDYFDTGGTGPFAINKPFPLKAAGILTQADIEDHGIRVTGKILIKEAGQRTFFIDGDDGNILSIDGKEVVNDEALHGRQTRFGTVNLTAGLHDLEYVGFERGGGSGFEFGAATSVGTFTSLKEAVFVPLPAAFVDDDKDGLLDVWEQLWFKNLNEAANGDPDKDNLTNKREYETKTNPTKADTDGDGINDDAEITGNPATNPNAADSDRDGIKDKDELAAKTNPNKADSDGDGLIDPDELKAKTDPNKADTDGDGWSDKIEIAFKGDPLKADPNAKYGPTGAAVFTSFEEPAPGATSFAYNNFEVGWNAVTAGTGRGVIAKLNDNTDDVPLPNQAIYIHNGSLKLTTDAIKISNPATAIVSIDARVFQTSSGIEREDFMDFKILASKDGVNFDQVITFLSIAGTRTGTSARAAMEDVLPVPTDEAPVDGPFKTFSSKAGQIPAGTTHIKIFIDAKNDSNSERFIFDNIVLRGTEASVVKPTTPPTGGDTRPLITAAQYVAGKAFDVSVASTSGAKYRLEYSEDLKTWQAVGNATASAAISRLSYTPPAGKAKGFVRVVKE